MRALLAATFIAVALCSLEARSGKGEWCSFNADARKQLADLGIAAEAPASPPSDRSSFKGIALGLTPGETAGTLFREGFEIWINTYVSPKDKVSSFEICHTRGKKLIGWVEFDQSGHAQRLTFQADYFFGKDISTRDFADRVFRHYKVQPDEVEDDACYQDVTCFRGRTDRGEQFLILKINGALRLYVRALRPGE
jgi:hypothetical protein